MRITYALEPHPKSIFLAGPTPRDSRAESWRPEAMDILRELGFGGEVIVPESPDWLKHDRYDEQIRWEWEGLDRATVVAFWIPRDLETMPAYTTNVEFGLLASGGKCVLGYPIETPKIAYLDALARRYHVPTHHSLRVTMAECVSICEKRDAYTCVAANKTIAGDAPWENTELAARALAKLEGDPDEIVTGLQDCGDGEMVSYSWPRWKAYTKKAAVALRAASPSVAEVARAEEREACAALADEFGNDIVVFYQRGPGDPPGNSRRGLQGADVAAAIRARTTSPTGGKQQ